MRLGTGGTYVCCEGVCGCVYLNLSMLCKFLLDPEDANLAIAIKAMAQS